MKEWIIKKKNYFVNLFRYILFHSTNAVIKTYYFLRIHRIYYFLKYLCHCYDTRQYSLNYAKSNFRILSRIKGNKGWLTSKSNGELKELSHPFRRFLFYLKNLCLLGAPQSRVFKIVNLTFLTFCIEVYNPFKKEVLKFFLVRKKALIERIAEGLGQINHVRYDPRHVHYHLNLFIRGSLLQMRVIEKMRKAAKSQKEPRVVKEIKEGLSKGVNPILITIGLSGAYWMRDANRHVKGIFKPFDEDIHAPNNPIGPIMQGALGQKKTRYGVPVGESAHREVGAYLIDQFFGFGIVPRTYYATFTHRNFYLAHESIYDVKRVLKTKSGSFQEYVEGFRPVHEFPKEVVNKIPLDEIQLLIVLDVILGNSDRNTNNLLISDDKIAAIDHGLVFPDLHEKMLTWYWESFDQGKEPFYPAIKDIILNFPYEQIAHLLRKKCFLSLNVVERMHERMVLFSVGVERGLVPADLAELFTPRYLIPLEGRKLTLKDKANEMLDLYVKQKKS